MKFKQFCVDKNREKRIDADMVRQIKKLLRVKVVLNAILHNFTQH